MTMTGTGDAASLYEQSLAEFRELGDELRVAIGLHRVAVQALMAGDDASARRLADESLAAHRRIGFRKGEAGVVSLLGDLERRSGTPERALELYELSATLAHETGFLWWEKNALTRQAIVCFALAQPDEAARRARQVLALAGEMDDRIGTVNALGLLARAAVEQGDYPLAGRLWGAAEAEAGRRSIVGWDPDNQHLEPVRRIYGDPSFEAGRAAGQEMAVDEVVDALATERGIPDD